MITPDLHNKISSRKTQICIIYTPHLYCFLNFPREKIVFVAITIRLEINSGINSAVIYRCCYHLYRGTIAKRTIPSYLERESTFTLTHLESPPVSCFIVWQSHASTTLPHSISKPHDKCAKVIESDQHVPPVCIRYVCTYICIGLRHAIVSIELLARNVDVSSANVGIYFLYFCHDASKFTSQTDKNANLPQLHSLYITNAKNLFLSRLASLPLFVHFLYFNFFNLTMWIKN